MREVVSATWDAMISLALCNFMMPSDVIGMGVTTPLDENLERSFGAILIIPYRDAGTCFYTLSSQMYYTQRLKLCKSKTQTYQNKTKHLHYRRVRAQL